jgi:hypothetical protein
LRKCRCQQHVPKIRNFVVCNNIREWHGSIGMAT